MDRNCSLRTMTLPAPDETLDQLEPPRPLLRFASAQAPKLLGTSLESRRLQPSSNATPCLTFPRLRFVISRMGTLIALALSLGLSFLVH